MNKNSIIYIFLILLLSGISYFVSSSFIVVGVVALSYTLYFFLVFKKRIDLYQHRISRFHSCYHFINSFIVALDIKGSLVGAFESVDNNSNIEFSSIYKGIKNNNEEEKLLYLGSFYPFDLYKLFLQIIKLWVEQGGEIMEAASHLINESKNSEDYFLSVQSINRTKTVEFITLWSFSLLILIVLRLSLSSFFSSLVNTPLFAISISVYFIFLLLSIHILLIKLTSISIKGWVKDE